MASARTRSHAPHASVSVRLEEGGLKAVARRLGSEVPTRADLDAECARLRVVAGFDEAAIERLCGGRVPANVDVVVARGAEAVPRRAETTSFRFVLPNDNRAYTGDAVSLYADYREGILAERVVAGAVLATRVPATEGAAGFTVTGRELPAEEVPGVSLVAGPNVVLSPDGERAIAAVGGTPTLLGGRVAVVVALELPAVNYATGNIHFDGPVVVRGDVGSGFTVCAAGDITVNGVVEGGTLLSGGSITVRAGARHGSRIEAVGDVMARFLDSDAEANALGDVTVLGAAVQCRLSAGRMARVASTVSGAVVRAGRLIDVDEAGAGRGTPSLLEIRRDVGEAERAQLEALCEELARYLALHEARARALPPSTDLQTRKWFVAERVQVEVELAFARARLAACDRDRAADPTAGEVVVRKALRPGVDVVVNGLVVPPVATPAGLRYTHSDRGKPYEPPSWVPPSSSAPNARIATPPPPERASLVAGRGPARHPPRGLTPAPFARSSLVHGSRGAYPPIPRAPTPAPFPRPSLVPGSQASYPAVPRGSTTPPPVARPNLLGGSPGSRLPAPREPTPAPFPAPAREAPARDEPTMPAPGPAPPHRRGR
jgi:hypothetical protein